MLRESIVIDADAFIALRSLGILSKIRDQSDLRDVCVICEYPARHELSQVQADVRDLEAAGVVVVHAVQRRTPAGEKYRQLTQAHVGKGEAEAIAWMLSRPKAERPILISADTGARRAAENHGLLAGDVFDFVVLLIEGAVLTKDVAKVCLFPWTERTQERGRPADLVPFDFDAAFKKRRAAVATQTLLRRCGLPVLAD